MYKCSISDTSHFARAMHACLSRSPTSAVELKRKKLMGMVRAAVQGANDNTLLYFDLDAHGLDTGGMTQAQQKETIEPDGLHFTNTA
jgi:hypothetical protein